MVNHNRASGGTCARVVEEKDDDVVCVCVWLFSEGILLPKLLSLFMIRSILWKRVYWARGFDANWRMRPSGAGAYGAGSPAVKEEEEGGKKPSRKLKPKALSKGRRCVCVPLCSSLTNNRDCCSDQSGLNRLQTTISKTFSFLFPRPLLFLKLTLNNVQSSGSDWHDIAPSTPHITVPSLPPASIFSRSHAMKGSLTCIDSSLLASRS